MAIENINKVEWFVFIFAILILSLYIYCQVSYPKLDKYIEGKGESATWISKEKLLKDAGNGDLIFFSGNTRGEKTCKWCTNSAFSHVGLLFREEHPTTGEDILYIWDSDMGQKARDGARVMRLQDKMDRYKGDKIGAYKPLLGERPSTSEILQVIKNLGLKDFDEKILTWWVAEKRKLYDMIKKEDEMFCSELVAATLQSLNILKKNKLPAWYSPGNFEKGTLDFEKGYSLGPTHFFRF